MNDLTTRAALPAVSDAALAHMRATECALLQQPQVPIITHHVLHGGLYTRTIKIPAGVVLTGALVKRTTTLILNGDAWVTRGDDKPARFNGHHVLPASAHRKQAFLAIRDTWLPMSFPTQATTIEQAEEEFTDEAHMLFSRTGKNVVVITGE
jgi:hypothetical protein